MRRNIKATINRHGQVIIPKALRDELGLKKGTVLDFVIEHDMLVVCKESDAERVDSVVNSLGAEIEVKK